MSKTRRKTALMGKLLELVRKQFERVNSGNDHPASTYTAMDCLMSRLAIFIFKFPSMLKFDDARDEPVLCGNLRRMFGVERAPTDSTLCRRLDEIGPKAVHRALRTLFGWLLRHRHLDPYRMADGALPLAVDGSGYYTSTRIRCDRCLPKKTRGGGIRYWHSILGATVVHPDVDQVIPAAVEPITKMMSDELFSLHSTTCFLYTLIEHESTRDDEKRNFPTCRTTTDWKADVERSRGQDDTPDFAVTGPFAGISFFLAH